MLIVEEVFTKTRNATVKSTEAQLRALGFSVRNQSKQCNAVQVAETYCMPFIG